MNFLRCLGLVIFIIFTILSTAQASTVQSPNNSFREMNEAIQEGKTEHVEELLNTGMNIATSTTGGCSFLVMAALQGNLDILKLLISKGADIHENTHDCLPLMNAAVHGANIELVKYLIQAGLSLTQNYGGRVSPLVEAIEFGNKRIVELYLATGGDPNATIGEGNTLLNIAAAKGEPAIIWLLIDNGAAVNKQNKDGNTALYMAVVSNEPYALRALLERGASTNIINNEGKNILQEAQRLGAIHARDTPKAQIIYNVLANVKPLTEPYPTYRPYREIEKAEQGGASEQYHLARAYYYGLKDVPQNYREAHYWFSVCAYTTSVSFDMGDERGFYKKAYSLVTQNPSGVSNDKKELEAMRALLADPQLKETCSIYLRTLRKKLLLKIF